MDFSAEGLLVILLVGFAAGRLAGQIARRAGFALVGALVIGVSGAFLGGWLFPQLGIPLGAGLVAATPNATIGALLLLLTTGLVAAAAAGAGTGSAGDPVFPPPVAADRFRNLVPRGIDDERPLAHTLAPGRHAGHAPWPHVERVR